MEPRNPGSIDKIRDDFRTSWSSGEPTSISDHLRNVAGSKRLQLLVALIEVDLECRAEQGQSLSASDYDDLGVDAVTIARFLLKQAKAENEASGEDSTQFIVDDDHVDGARMIDDGLTRGLDGSTKDDDSLFDETVDPSLFTEVPRFIDRYQLLRRIGMGGMGAVWLAEQHEPVRRLVALKVIRTDVGAKSTVARFEAERQAIALMDHQNIAKILDAGTTATGNPYFVMELVDGVPLNEYCDKNRLGIRERLELMIPICRAVQHAHQKAILHRDLKHSNVLVAEYDGQPVPKVIDFGLAKALGRQQTLTDKTMDTEIGNILGTIQYMSPEQADSRNDDVDTRADIYSLGVMIYKLLVGSTPLENSSDVEVSPWEALRFIREKDPRRPSEVVQANSETIQALSRLRKLTPEKLRQNLQGDLDWIVMKALEKDRLDRYDTANALAMELERYLRDERVLARPPSTTYAIRKFVKRNRGLVVSASGIGLLLVVGIVATSIATWWALKERNRANDQADLLRIETQNAQDAERDARESEAIREIELLAMRLKSAWSDWQLGDTESAWVQLNQLKDDENGWESRFLRSEFSASQQTLFGHARHVISLDVSRDDTFIATAAGDNSIRIWDGQSKQLIHTLFVSEEPTCVRFSNDSKHVACTDRSNCVTLWSTDTGQTIDVFGPYPTDVMCLSFLGETDLLAIGFAGSNSYRDGALRIYEQESPPSILIVSQSDGSVRQELTGHLDDIRAIAGSPNGDTIASGSLDTTVRIWRRIDQIFEPLHVLDKHFQGVTNVEISPSGNQLLSSAEDHTIRLWDIEPGELLQTMVGHSDDVQSARFSRDGNRIVSASTDRTARVWDLHGNTLLTCHGHFDTLFDASFLNADAEIVTASSDQTIRVWDSEAQRSTMVVQPHDNVVWAADCSPDGTTIATASEDGTVALINAADGKVLPIDLPHESAILSLSFSPDSSVLVTGTADNQIIVWSCRDYSRVQTIDAHEGFVWDLSFSTDSRYLISASADMTAKIWRTSDWESVDVLRGHSGELGSARFSRDGELIVTAGDDGLVLIWDAKTFEVLHKFTGHQNAIWRATFSPDGKWVVSSGFDGELIVWDLEKKSIKQRIGAHTDQVAGLTFTEDGSRIVTASDDATIRIWDLDSGIELFVLRDLGDVPITHVSFSDDGQKMVSGNSLGYVTIRSLFKEYVDARPFLPQDVVRLTTIGLQNVLAVEATEKMLIRELDLAKKCCVHYPSYKTFTNLGISQFRLGEYEDAVTSLSEADRLEPIEYGEPDELPYIEAYLAMSLRHINEHARAKVLRDEFRSKREAYWLDDERVTRVANELERVFESVP